MSASARPVGDQQLVTSIDIEPDVVNETRRLLADTMATSGCVVVMAWRALSIASRPIV